MSDLIERLGTPRKPQTYRFWLFLSIFTAILWTIGIIIDGPDLWNVAWLLLTLGLIYYWSKKLKASEHA